MRAQRDWCGLVGWLLAASLVALQVQFANAAENPSGPSITINRGETYVIKGVSPDSTPEVKPIDNPHSLIVNKQPNGDILVLGAEAGSETVNVKMADGSAQAYTVTVIGAANPANPLAPSTAPEAMGSGTATASGEPMDAGSGPAATAPSKDASATSAPATSGSGDTISVTPSSAAPASPDTTASTPASAPDSSAAAPKAADSAGTSAPAATANTGSSPAAAPTAEAASAPAPAPSESSAAAAPMGLSPTNSSTMPSQAVSAAVESSATKYSTDPHISNAGVPIEPPSAAHHYLPNDAITMMFGTSRVFDFPERIKRISIADSAIADVQVVNPYQLMLIGHKPGFTTLAVWDNQGNYVERQVRIEQTGQQQVMLNCVVAEVNRSRLENQGINYSGALQNAGVTIVGLPGQVATPFSPLITTSSNSTTGSASSSTSTPSLVPGGSLMPLVLSPNLTYGLATQNGNVLTQNFFQYLEQHNLARILAEPHILANSGQEAKFLEGGEIPIVIAQALNTSVVFKQYGTSVVFIPTVIGRNQIELVVKPEVSKPDFSQGVQLFGFTLPAFVQRRAETVVRMKDAQTLIIAGLIQDDKHEVIDKVPYLGDIPLAGGLFRNTTWQDTKTELVMSVTPQIVGALPSGAQVAIPDKGSLTAHDIETTRLSAPDAGRPRF